jgi:hypothetical protein
MYVDGFVLPVPRKKVGDVVSAEREAGFKSVVDMK